MRRYLHVLSIVLFIVALINSTVLAANASISGYVKDAKTGEPLLGANVMLIETSMGAITDINGKYVIKNVIPGKYIIRASYIGYQGPDIEISIKEGEHLIQNFSLEPIGVEGQLVVVTAQASGQKQAINQQLAADQIMNVVSAAKIQELPDANAAESVGRLPGVSILRDGGEGNEVVIRGLAPKFNNIMIDGVAMSSSNSYDRSTDLSMISSNMLEGIQVSKTVTADMDAEVIGGTVNFELREAREKNSESIFSTNIPQFEFLSQGGYNDLANAYNKFNNYKYVLSAENRYFDHRFGIFAQIDIERKNLASNEMGASYTHVGNSKVDYSTIGIGLSDILRDRNRYNGAVVMDYQIPEGKIKLANFVSSGSTDIQNRQESYDISGNQHYYRLFGAQSKLNIITNSFSYNQQLSVFQVDAKLAHTYSETKSPDDWTVDFVQPSAGLGNFINKANVNPMDVPKAANNDLSNTILNSITTSNSFSKERTLTAALDLKTQVNISEMISSEIKFGGKYRYQTRYYNFDENDNGTGPLYYGGAKFLDNMITSHFGIPVTSTSVPVTYFADKNYDYGEFLGGDYKMGLPLNYGMFSEMVKYLKDNTRYIAANKSDGAYGYDYFQSITNDYSGHEDQSAAYLMATLKIGPQITIIPGIRYQNLQTTYTGVRGIQTAESYRAYNHYDTTVVQNHGYWLPNLNLRYKPFTWCDIRLSYTKTLAYPDFAAIIPRINVGLTGGGISYNNFELSPSRSTNYDAYFSLYDNTIGLFTAGAFLKQIEDLIYGWQFYVSGKDALKYFPQSLIGSSNPTSTFPVVTYVNNSYRIDNYGMELDWQTHFWYLPGPLSGLVMSVNYTHIFSKAQYPYVDARSNGRRIQYVDTSFTARLLYQPDDIVNISLGYDYRDFSARLSLLYQDDIFSGVIYWPQLRSNTSAYRRWDIALKQELPWFNLQLFGDINNINGARDIYVIQGGGGVPTSEQDYGMTATFGLRLKL